MITFELYRLSDLVFSGSNITLASGYDRANNTSLEVIDDDTTLEGDYNDNEEGNDQNQFGTATFADGTVVGSPTTTTYSEEQYTLTAPDGTTILLLDMEIDSNPNSNTGSGIRIGYLPSSPLVAGVTYTFTQSNTLPSNSPEYATMQMGAVCFAKSTKIATSKGAIKIEHINQGDLVMTSEGLKPVRWIGSQRYSARELKENPNLLPVRISAGSLGHNVPQCDLLVSRQHRMVVRSKIAARMFGQIEVLIPAIKLTAHPGISVDASVQEVDYFHMMFDQHETVFAEGAAAESLYIGEESIKNLPASSLKEIDLIFPGLTGRSERQKYAKSVPDPKRQKRCVARHIKSGQLFQSDLTELD